MGGSESEGGSRREGGREGRRAGGMGSGRVERGEGEREKKRQREGEGVKRDLLLEGKIEVLKTCSDIPLYPRGHQVAQDMQRQIEV